MPMRWVVLLRAGIAAGLLGGVVAALVCLPVPEYLLRLLAYTQSLGYGGPVLLLGISVLACLLFLPGSLVILAAGFLFGMVWGVVTASLGAVLGATAAFLIARGMARRWIERKAASHPRFLAVDRAIANQAFTIVLLVRLCSLFPYSLSSYVFGLTRVPLRPYVLATWLGRLPATILYVYLGSTAKNLVELASSKVRVSIEEQILLGVGLVAMAVVAWVVTRIARRALDETLNGQDD